MEATYGPAAIAKASEMYKAHLDRSFMPPERPASAFSVSGEITDKYPLLDFEPTLRNLIWATDLDLIVDAWLQNEETFRKLFDKIGAPEVYVKIGEEDFAKRSADLMEDEWYRDWLLNSAPTSILNKVLKNT